jgi:hypothetical protein
MAGTVDFSKDFPLDVGIFKTAKLTLGASTDANAAEAILTNDKFPDGNIELGHISFSADSGQVSLNPGAVGGATVSFEIKASAQTGVGVYGKSADAIKALNLGDTLLSKIDDVAGQRYLLMDWGYSASFSGSASHPIGVLGSVSFGVDAKRNSVFALLHRFDQTQPNQGAHEVLEDTIKSWRLPRHVAFVNGDVNLKPATWLIAEADGSFGIKLATSLGWNMNFAKDAKILGVTHNLSAKVDASLKANFGFNVSGKYIVVVGRESADNVVRLRLFKQSSKGLDFGFNLDVGIKGADPQLPSNFDDFIKSTFGVHGLQVLNDVREWADPTTDLGQKLAGLAGQTALDLLKRTTNIDPVAEFSAEFNKAKKFVGDALNTWASLPDKLSSMLWVFLGKEMGTPAEGDFKAFLAALADPDPNKRADEFGKVLQNATFGDTPQGKFLEAIADKGLLALGNDLASVSSVAAKVLDVLDGGVVKKLQDFINEKLDLTQIKAAVDSADITKVEQWLQNRLGNFLDKTLGLDELKDVQKAIDTLNSKVSGYYKTAVQALTKRYSIDFATTYQKTTTDTALIDVDFKMDDPAAAALFADVVGNSHLDDLLTIQTTGVTLHQASLTHEINRKGTVDLNMPFFDFSSTHVNDAMVTLTAEDHGGRLLIYQINAKDKVTVANRASSQLAVLASLKVTDGQAQVDSDGSVAYEMRQVKADMRPLDLKDRTTEFIHQYLGGLFGGGEASIGTFYADLDNALTAATGNQSNHLGDTALTMQVSLKASTLAGWFQPRSVPQLRADQMGLSRALQAAWKNLLPTLYFQDLSLYGDNPSVAALLVWASLPVSTSIDFADFTIKRFNTDKDVFWNHPDVDLRRAVARDSHTIATLGARLSAIKGQLQEAGNGNADHFDPRAASGFVEMALNATGDNFFRGLLFTEAELVGGATDALKQVGAALAKEATAPTQAIKTLANFAADLTDTFNNRVSSLYSGMSGRVVGPMLLVESSKVLGSTVAKPIAMLSLYALKPGHTFKLGTFVDGQMPPKAETALTQTLVSL